MRAGEAVPGKAVSSATRFALATIILHVAVVILHGAAHQALGINASPAQLLFIVTIIMMGPPLAGLLLWKRRDTPGPIALTLVMAGAFVFGVYNHFILFSPDHVSHVSSTKPGGWAVVFQATAILLAVTEGLGCCAGLLLAKRAYVNQDSLR
jgi:hypothetical protein